MNNIIYTQKIKIDVGEPDDLSLYKYITDYNTFWEEAMKYDYEMIYNYNDSEFSIKVNWPKRKIIYNSYSEDDIPSLLLEIIIATNKVKKEYHDNLFKHLVSYYLSQLFLIFNMSAPGCFDCYFSKLWSSMGNDININLSSTMWFGYLSVYDKYCWPNIKTIPAITTFNWLKKINLKLKQTATNSIERVLFALLNYSYGWNISPIKILWLTLALESLYEVPSSGIIKTLRNRIFLVVGEPTQNSKIIKKIIDGFYDIRSRIVHGEFNISLPESMEYFDFSKMDQDIKLIRNEEYALSIVIATLQKMILSSSTELVFNEIVQYRA